MGGEETATTMREGVCSRDMRTHRVTSTNGSVAPPGEESKEWQSVVHWEQQQLWHPMADPEVLHSTAGTPQWVLWFRPELLHICFFQLPCSSLPALTFHEVLKVSLQEKGRHKNK